MMNNLIEQTAKLEQEETLPETPDFIRNFYKNCAFFDLKTAFGRLQNDHVEAITYSELHKKAIDFAGYLQNFTSKGERAAILTETGLEFIIAFYGCIIAGIIPVPCSIPNPKKADGLRNIIDDCDARIIIGLSGTLKKFTPVLNSSLIAIASDNIPSGYAFTPPAIKETDVAFLQYTSGTTSDPKGVMVTYKNLQANLKMIKDRFEFTPQLVMVSWLPFYHDMGLVGMILSPLHAGGTGYYLSPMEFILKPLEWLKAITTLKGNCTGVPNFALEHCVSRIADEQGTGLDLTGLKTLFCGSEPIRHQTLKTFNEKFRQFGLSPNALYPCYGMAELALFATAGKVGQHYKQNSFDSAALFNKQVKKAAPGAAGAIDLIGCGFAAQNSQVIIVDPQTQTETPQGIGEIWITGPHVSAGYWGKPQITQNTFKARLNESPGTDYLRTGDLGFIFDEQLYISGRIKDVIIMNGRNIYPTDIEICVNNSHQDLNEGRCAAFSVWRDTGEVLIIVKEIHRSHYKMMDEFIANAGPDGETTGKLVVDYCKAIQKSVADTVGLVIDDLIVVAQNRLPVTTSGKIRRAACKDLYLNNELNGHSLTSLLKNILRHDRA
ncbi:fatty acyl-AMP ligase [Mucilaginibacter phyllosphaerae]|uniref:Acyl-CoA synthetase (AMP-forming)/AMP-acid ligase II n=1 Tax=Mucilaginibacter phyllosphaerae TaxID=1812349 RepID=A0A4Y8AFU3_9SPHI|nr:fatty acyl-AMP ligase [Mucilaginibacter phyllosphaerae]MBB3968726.1 acyl-CoA synthetase (AMP-forming)/AMP-acid ligase II [Mucilaginibacter phyllosphaerae]TEW67638.1 fatty acyl-AMP ligase [Mucilaginibacter phyllosphaerae]GGH14263.1 acyl-CoA synthetase [Mucilaginibacter phyllosphaerae]